MTVFCCFMKHFHSASFKFEASLVHYFSLKPVQVIELLMERKLNESTIQTLNRHTLCSGDRAWDGSQW